MRASDKSDSRFPYEDYTVFRLMTISASGATDANPNLFRFRNGR